MKHKSLFTGMLVLAASVSAQASVAPQLDYDCTNTIKALAAMSTGLDAQVAMKNPTPAQQVIDTVVISNVVVSDTYVDGAGNKAGTISADVTAPDASIGDGTGKIVIRATRGGCILKSLTINN
jgi:hypothetical protein